MGLTGFPGGSDSNEFACNLQETWVQLLGQEDPLEKGMATHSGIHAWKNPWIEELGMGLQRVRPDWVTYTHTARLTRTLHVTWQFTPVAPSAAFQVNALILLALSQFKFLYYSISYYYEMRLKTSAAWYSSIPHPLACLMFVALCLEIPTS